MAGDPFKHVHAGDPIELHHVSFNAMLDAGREFRARNRLGSGSPAPSGWTPNWIRVRNTGSNAERFHVLGLGEPVIDPDEHLEGFQATPALDGSGPGSSHWGKFGILARPLAQNEIGPALISGIIPVQIDVGHEAHGYADIKTSDKTKLQSGFIGAAEILWKESGTGTKWGIVRLGTPTVPTYFARTDGSIGKNSYGTVSVFDSGWTDTGANLEQCYNYTANMAAGTNCSLTFIRSKPGEKWLPVIAPISC